MTDVFMRVAAMPPPTVEDRVRFVKYRGDDRRADMCQHSVYTKRQGFKLTQCENYVYKSLFGVKLCHAHYHEILEGCECLNTKPGDTRHNVDFAGII